MSGTLTGLSGRRRLPRAARLHASGDIRRVIRRGRRHTAGPYVVHGLLAPEGAGSRMAAVVPRRVGTQVVRNRIKRLLREAFRLERAGWERCWDLVVYVRSAPDQPTLDEVTEMMRGAVRDLERASGGRP